MKALSFLANFAEEKYRSIFEHAIIGIFQTTLEGRFLTVNPALVHMLGYASAEALLEHPNDFGAPLYVNASQQAEIIRHLAEHGTVASCEVQLSRRDGSVLWASLNMRAVRNEEGAVLSYAGTLEDITTRKHAEQQLRESETRFRSIAEAATDAIIVCDGAEKIIAWNYAAEVMFGSTAQEVLGTAIALVIPERYRGAIT